MTSFTEQFQQGIISDAAASEQAKNMTRDEFAKSVIALINLQKADIEQHTSRTSQPSETYPIVITALGLGTTQYLLNKYKGDVVIALRELGYRVDDTMNDGDALSIKYTPKNGITRR